MTDMYYCSVCGESTDHKDGQCVECAHAVHQETVAWMRTKRKAFMIVVAIGCIVGINWVMAQQWSGDDMTRAALGALVTAITTWFSTSKAAEDKVK